MVSKEVDTVAIDWDTPPVDPLTSLPQARDLGELGLDPAQRTQAHLLHERHGHAVYRLECGARSFVLKWFGDPAPAVEVSNYALLQANGVPTLPVHGRTTNALLLEDLSNSQDWRAAVETDVGYAETGVGVAGWYRALHAAGQSVVGSVSGPPHLRREMDGLDAQTVRELAQQLGNADDTLWALAADSIEPLKAAMCSLPETLTYNDFHWTNLALTRHGSPARRAIVFDYHLLGVGLAASDYRNVLPGLKGQAQAAFREAYGPIDARAALLDAPVALLYSLSVAVRRPRFPPWGERCLQSVRDGTFERSLREALSVLEDRHAGRQGGSQDVPGVDPEQATRVRACAYRHREGKPRWPAPR